MDNFQRSFHRDEFVKLGTFISQRYEAMVDMLKTEYNLSIPEHLEKNNNTNSQTGELARFVADKLKISNSSDSDTATLHGMRFLAQAGKDIPEDKFLDGLDDKVKIIKDNYPDIIKIIQKEYPNLLKTDRFGILDYEQLQKSVRAYLSDTSNVDDKKVEELALFMAEHAFLKNEESETKKEKIAKGVRWLAEIGETAFWTQEKYVQNFPAILTYLEKHDGLDVSAIREMYFADVEKNKQNPLHQRGGEIMIKSPSPTVDSKLQKIVESKFEGSRETVYNQARKYYRVTVLKAVLDQQKQLAQMSKQDIYNK